MRFPMNTYQGEGTSREEQFQINVITSLICGFYFILFFFKWQFPFWHIQQLFQGGFIFGEASSSHFFNYFDTTITLSEHLFLQSSCFFKDLRFRKSHFLAAVIFSEYLIFRNKTSTEQPYCKNSKFFRAVTFQNSYFLGGVIAWNKDIYGRAPLIKADTSTQNQHFQKSYIFEKPSFPGELPFQSGHFSKRHYFLQQQPFQKSYKHIFSEELLFHSYA